MAISMLTLGRKTAVKHPCTTIKPDEICHVTAEGSGQNMTDSGIDLCRSNERTNQMVASNKLGSPATMTKTTTHRNSYSLHALNKGLPSLPLQSTMKMLEKGVRIKQFSELSKASWLNGKLDRGFIRLYDPNSNLRSSVVVPLSLNTTCKQIADRFGVPDNTLFVQYNGDTIRRLEPLAKPLELQDAYLRTIGFSDESSQLLRRQMGDKLEIGYLVRFFIGRPYVDDGFGLSILTSYCHVRRGRIFHQWNRRLCILDGSRLLIYPTLSRSDLPDVIPLSRSKVEESYVKGRGRCIKVTSIIPFRPIQTIFLGFDDISDLNAWLSRCIKAAAKVPPISDLSNLQLEHLPEQVFCIGSERLLTSLNLRHNCLMHRPEWENVQAVGWLEDLPRLESLRSLNLADNHLCYFPPPLLELSALTELNLSSNGLRSVPPELARLPNLAQLNLQNNLLSNLPLALTQSRVLAVLDLSFNLFETVPKLLYMTTGIHTWSLAGNNICELAAENALNPLTHVLKIDLRLNSFSVVPKVSFLQGTFQCLSHIDVRQNLQISTLDLTTLPMLTKLECQQNKLSCLQLNGTSLAYLYASDNLIDQFSITPAPSNLKIIEISRNQLVALPSWLGDLTKIDSVSANHNFISSLPERIFCSSSSLRTLSIHHNDLRYLPREIENCYLESLDLHHNKLNQLPHNFLSSLPKLRYVNLSQNFLKTLPPLNRYLDLNKVQQLILSANRLSDAVLSVIVQYRRLRILDLSYNHIRQLDEEVISEMTALEELSISGNRLRTLPSSLVTLPNLVILRAHSNSLTMIPDLTGCASLHTLDLANNKLHADCLRLVITPHLKHLDLACNIVRDLDKKLLAEKQSDRPVAMIDMGQKQPSNPVNQNVVGDLPTTGTTRNTSKFLTEGNVRRPPWQIGFCETSGNRNKLCVNQIRCSSLSHEEPAENALFGLVDGGLSNQVSALLAEILPGLVSCELSKHAGSDALKFAMLSAQVSLKAMGQRLGSSCVLCHVTSVETSAAGTSDMDDSRHYELNVTNVGHSEAILCRLGQPISLTQTHVLNREVRNGEEEYRRVKEAGGIFTSDGCLNGITSCTRLLGSSFLYPSLIPDPHCHTVRLGESDEFLIIANKSLWEYMTYMEAIRRVRYIPNPILAAKHLQDIAQSYGSTENLSIIVIRFFFNPNLPIPPSLPDSSSFQPVFGHKIFSATNLASSNESVSTIGDVRSEPAGKARERPNYYFEYKKQLKEMLQSESTIYDSMSSCSSRLSSLTTLIDSPEIGEDLNSTFFTSGNWTTYEINFDQMKQRLCLENNDYETTPFRSGVDRKRTSNVRLLPPRSSGSDDSGVRHKLLSDSSGDGSSSRYDSAEIRASYGLTNYYEYARVGLVGRVSQESTAELMPVYSEVSAGMVRRHSRTSSSPAAIMLQSSSSTGPRASIAHHTYAVPLLQGSHGKPDGFDAARQQPQPESSSLKASSFGSLEHDVLMARPKDGEMAAHFNC